MSSLEQQVVYRQTVVESGIGGGCSCPPGGIFTPEAVRDFASQHETEKREMRDLNDKLGGYVRHLRAIEEDNRRLQGVLDDLKRQWGFDSAQIKDSYDEELVRLRKQIDDISQEKALDELQAKRAECDILSTKNLIDVARQLINMDNDRLLKLRQQLDASQAELDAMRIRYDDKRQELQRSRDEFERLQNALKELKDRFDEEAMGRVTVQNELQTIEEQIAFMKAVHEEERNELMSLGTLPFDNTQFYRTELTRVINAIKSDFDSLARDRQGELEGYYRFKTEEFHKYVEEQKRRRTETEGSSAEYATDVVTLRPAITKERDENEELQKENASLLTRLQQLEAEYEDAANRARRNQEQRDQKQAELCNEVRQRELDISNIIDNNVSLQFEINTYRRLLELEGNRDTQRAPAPPQPVIPPPVQQPTADVRTMTVQKSAQGPVSIDQVDPEGNFIVLENVGGNNRDQDLTGWTIRRKIDAQEDIVYRFPDNYRLPARSRVRVLSQQAPRNSFNDRDVLVAQNIPIWGIGNTNETRLFDNQGAPKALFKQSFA